MCANPLVATHWSRPPSKGTAKRVSLIPLLGEVRCRGGLAERSDVVVAEPGETR